MGSVKEKMSYLNGTKEKLKEMINYCGGGITNDTPFRQYSNKLYDQYKAILKDRNVLLDNIPKKTKDNSVVQIDDAFNFPNYNLKLTKPSRQDVSLLPGDYTEVEYIESDGNQYINTGVYLPFQANFDIYYKNKKSNAVGNGGFGYYNTNGFTFEEQSWNSSDAKNILIFGTSVSNGYSFPDGFFNKIRHLQLIGNSLYVDGELFSTYERVGDNTATTTLLLGAYRSQGVIENNKGVIMGRMTFSYNNEILFDGIPCYRNSDNEVGLYDLVNDVFHTNQGTGVFTYGNVKYKKRDLPKEYTQIEYIESTGNQYIDTGYSNEHDTTNTYDITFAVTSYNHAFGFYGAEIGNTAYRTSMLWSNASGVLKVSSGSTLSSSSTYTGSYILNKRTEKIVYCNNSTKKYSVDGAGEYTYTGVSNNPNPVFIFDPSPVRNPGQCFIGRLYGFKLFGDNFLVRDFVPCLRNEDNKPGLYDFVNQKFYASAGSQDFLYKELEVLPEEYVEVDYIESTGTQYIDLDFKATQDYGAEIEYAVTSTASSDSARVFGTRNGTGGIGAFAFISSGNGAASSTIYIASHEKTYAPNSSSIDTNWHVLKDNINNDKKVYWDDNLVITGEDTTWTATGSCNVFRTYNSSGYAAIAKAKVKKIKIYNNSVLIHDYIPCCRKDNDSIIGLYDIIERRFFSNSGTGTFNKGLEVTIPNPHEVRDIKTIKGILPSIYTQLDYIASSGTQYIDIELLPKDIRRVELTIKNTEFSKTRYIGAYGADQYFLIGQQDGKYVAQWGPGASSQTRIWPIIEVGKHTITLDFKQQFSTIDNESDATLSNTILDSISANVCLFCANNAGTQGQFATIKLFRCKIYGHQGLIRDLIPCYRNSDNEVGLYDIVQHKFYTNDGTGVFTHDDAIESNTINLNWNDGKHNIDYLIPLKDNEICQIGDYKDELIIDKNGHCWLNKNIGKVILDGTETVAVNNTGTSNWYYAVVKTMDNFIAGQGISSHYLYNAISNSNTAQGFATVGNPKSIRIRYGTEDTDTNFKTWLANNNVIVYYVLESSNLIDLEYEIDLTLLENITNNISNSERANLEDQYISVNFE